MAADRQDAEPVPWRDLCRRHKGRHQDDPARSAKARSLGVAEGEARTRRVGVMSATCRTCGLPFRPQRSTARFCSSRCRKTSQRARDRGTPVKVAATRPGVVLDAVLSVTTTIGMSERQKPESVTLRRKPPKLDPRIVPDPKWPGMYRIRRPDGSLSDMANLTRCRDVHRSFDGAAAS